MKIDVSEFHDASETRAHLLNLVVLRSNNLVILKSINSRKCYHFLRLGSNFQVGLG